jgi:integrating conjugative element membrane protein (TIGR03747 family)
MTKRPEKSLPSRKEPGLFARTFTAFFGVIFWMVLSLMLSIVIEWLGITFFWPEQGHHHALTMLHVETRYLNHHVLTVASQFDRVIYHTTQRVVAWVANDSGIKPLIQWMASPSRLQEGVLSEWGHTLTVNYKPYLLAVPAIIQLFFVRMAIIVFSLPAFLLLAIVGIVDGLVERDLRRWGGGRESSNLYNLARKMVSPLSILACVLYISSPVTVHPGWIIIPFSSMVGLSLRITFSRLKKYF